MQPLRRGGALFIVLCARVYENTNTNIITNNHMVVGVVHDHMVMVGVVYDAATQEGRGLLQDGQAT